MSATINTNEFLPALTLKYLTSSHQLTIDEGDEVALAWFDDQWQWHAVSLKDFQTAHIAAHEVEQYDLKTAAIIVDRNGEGWGPSSKSETGLVHRPVARAITLSSVH